MKIQSVGLIFVILSSVLIFPIAMEPINFPKFLILLVGGSVILFLFFINQVNFLSKINKQVMLLVSLYLFLLLVAALVSKQSVFATLTGTWGRNNGIIMSILFMLFFMLFSIPSKNNISSQILKTLFYFGLFSSIYAWLQFFNKDPLQYYFSWYNKNDAIIITVGNSNFASIFLAMTYSSAMVIFFSKPKFDYLRILAVMSIVTHLLLIPKLDTQGKISFGLSTVIIVGVVTVNSKYRYLRFAGFAWWILSLAVGIFGLLGLKGIGVFAGVLSDNIRSLSDRYYAWLAAINMMKDSPLFGKGIDSFGFFYRNFRDPNSNEIVIGQPFITYDNAHNTYLQLGATAGVPVLIVYLVLIILICWRSWVALRYSEDKVTIAGLLSIWLIYLLQSFVSMDQIGLAIWGWVSAGTLVGLSCHVNKEKLQSSYSTNDNSEGIKLKPISVILGATIFLMPSVYYFPVLKNESNLYFAIRNIPILRDDVSKDKNFDRIIKEGYKAKQLELRLTTVRYLGASNKVNEAILLAEFSAKQEPRSFSAWHLVAGLYEISGRYKEAVPAREKTIQLDPHNKIVKDLLRLIK